jgi:hypothetical protein
VLVEDQCRRISGGYPSLLTHLYPYHKTLPVPHLVTNLLALRGSHLYLFPCSLLVAITTLRLSLLQPTVEGETHKLGPVHSGTNMRSRSLAVEVKHSLEGPPRYFFRLLLLPSHSYSSFSSTRLHDSFASFPFSLSSFIAP